MLRFGGCTGTAVDVMRDETGNQYWLVIGCEARFPSNDSGVTPRIFVVTKPDAR
jgi:hypothetical protein